MGDLELTCFPREVEVRPDAEFHAGEGSVETTGKMLCFPNGYRTTSDRLSRINVLPFLSTTLTQVYVEVFELGQSVYRGLIDLDQMEVSVGNGPQAKDLES